MTGFVNVFKPEGMSSARAVARIKYLTGTPCGHMGTLDPLAEGVLPVGVGNASRLFDYFLSKQKTYLARFVFGATTETLDREGEVVKGGRIPSEGEIAAVLPRFTGEIGQVPPRYSALSVDGQRGYRLARGGKEFDLPERRVTIAGITLKGQTAPDEFAFEIVCGAGTYIRALARDIAAALGTQGYMSRLRRTASGPFTEESAVLPERLDRENISSFLIPTESVLPFPVLGDVDEHIFHGIAVPVGAADGLYKLFRGGSFYGIARVEGGRARAEKKLC